MPLYRLSQSQRRLQRQNKAFPPLRQHTRTMKTRKKKKETQTPITSIFVSVQWSRGSLLHHILKAWPCWWSFCLDCNLNNRLMSSPLEIIHIRQYCLPFSPVPRAARSKTIATGRRACTPLPPLLFFLVGKTRKKKGRKQKRVRSSYRNCSWDVDIQWGRKPPRAPSPRTQGDIEDCSVCRAL